MENLQKDMRTMIDLIAGIVTIIAALLSIVVSVHDLSEKKKEHEKSNRTRQS